MKEFVWANVVAIFIVAAFYWLTTDTFGFSWEFTKIVLAGAASLPLVWVGFAILYRKGIV